MGSDIVIAQNDIIASQTALTEKLQAKVQSLEKLLAAAREAAIPVESNAKPDPKEVRALKDGIAKMKSEINAKDQRSGCQQLRARVTDVRLIS